jgi:hypothetical protein
MIASQYIDASVQHAKADPEGDETSMTDPTAVLCVAMKLGDG